VSEAVVRDISAKKRAGTRLARAGKREFPKPWGVFYRGAGMGCNAATGKCVLDKPHAQSI